ncbi:MAG: DUF4126 domain-containing protein [Chloroflexi bacterium]|nr:MAG: DUF4126 domain-containing protein [Chloroflexota bacterium]TMG61840.1 MAG: DUF4126 domain-containing protein [Chloroflexota bacterium]
MNPGLMALPAAFGLAGASGLNATLPLLIVSLLARLGLIHLAPPFDALSSDIAFWGLLVLAVVEFAVDKVPALDSVGHAVMLPVSAAAGAILFASQTGTISSMDSGLAVIVSLLAGGAISGTVHVTRAAVRPVANFAFLGPPLSLMEDIASATLSVTAALIPILVPFVLVLIALGAMLLWQRRRATRPSVTSAR